MSISQPTASMKLNIIRTAEKFHYRPPVASLIIAVAIAWLTLAPKPVGDSSIHLFDGADKIVHAVMFGALTATMSIDLTIWRRSKPSVLILVAIALTASVAGGAIELIQDAMSVGRSAETADFIADIAGAFAALFCIVVARQ